MTVRADGDDALLQGVAQGDRAALEALYRRHSPWLVVRLSRRCADPGLVEEVVQDTFVAVWRGAGRYRGSGEVPAWIWGIGIRRLIDRLRRSPVIVSHSA
ncbi:MAG: RNA polymerase sigma factor, partial [Actinomycetota bacterium]